MSVPCGIFSHYLKLLLCVLKFQNPSNALPLWPKTKRLPKYGETLICIIFLLACFLSLSYPSYTYLCFNASPSLLFICLCGYISHCWGISEMSGFFNLTQLWRSWVAYRWPKCFVGFLEGARKCEWVWRACIKKKKSFSLKRAEKGSVTSMKVNDASFPCPPPAPSHTLFIILEG